MSLKKNDILSDEEESSEEEHVKIQHNKHQNQVTMPLKIVQED